MSVSRTLDSTRTQFPYLLEVDMAGVTSINYGLSPAFQEVLVNVRQDPTLSPEEIFAPYTVDTGRGQHTLKRNTSYSVFSDDALGSTAFHLRNAAGGKASIFIPEDLLEAQEMFVNEIACEVGMHKQFLHHCIDISHMYQDQVPQGPIGVSDSHNRVGKEEKSTPLEAYHDLLLTKFDVDKLNIPLNQRGHFTLADLAIRALQLIAPIRHGQSTTDTWTMSNDLFVAAKGFLKGEMAPLYGELVDGDGNHRYAIQMPGMNINYTEIDANRGDTPIPTAIFRGHMLANNTGIMTKISDCYETDLSDVDLTDLGYIGSDTDARWAQVFMNGVPLSKLPGSRQRFASAVTAAQSAGIGAPGEMLHMPYIGDLIAPRFFDAPISIYGHTGTGQMVSVSELIAANFPRRLWDQPTHVVLDVLRKASSILTPQFRAVGVPEVDSFTTAGPAQAGFNFSQIVDLHNMFSYHKHRFNPVKQIDANNGPYGVSDSDRSKYWVVERDGRSYADKSGILDEVFGDLTVPSGYGSTEIPLKNLIALLPDKSFEALFTPDPSSVDKRSRQVILPTGRSASSMSIASSAKDADMAAHTMLLRTLPFATWRTVTLMPLSDIRYQNMDQVSLSDISVERFTMLPGPMVNGPFQTDVLASTSSGTLVCDVAEDFKVIGSHGPLNEGHEVINGTVEVDELKEGETHAKVRVLGDTEVPMASLLNFTVNRTNPALDYAGGNISPLLCNGLDQNGNELFITDIDIDYVTESGYIKGSASVVNALTPFSATSVSISGNLLDTLTYDGSKLTVLSGEKATDFTAKANALFSSAGVEVFDVSTYDTTVKIKNAIAKGAGNVEMLSWDMGLYTLTCEGASPLWTGSLPFVFTSCNLKTNGDHLLLTPDNFVWKEPSGDVVTGTSDTPSGSAFYSKHMNIARHVVLRMGTEAYDHTQFGSPSSFGSYTGMGDTDESMEVRGEYLLPELNNIMVRLDLQLFDAAISKYSNMRLYPRAINMDERFRGLPYFGEPQSFLRGLVKEVQSSLVAIDHVSASPFTTSNINELRITTETYDQMSYITTVRSVAAAIGNMHSLAPVEGILNAQNSLVKRGQI